MYIRPSLAPFVEFAQKKNLRQFELKAGRTNFEDK